MVVRFVSWWKGGDLVVSWWKGVGLVVSWWKGGGSVCKLVEGWWFGCKFERFLVPRDITSGRQTDRQTDRQISSHVKRLPNCGHDVWLRAYACLTFIHVHTHLTISRYSAARRHLQAT